MIIDFVHLRRLSTIFDICVLLSQLLFDLILLQLFNFILLRRVIIDLVEYFLQFGRRRSVRRPRVFAKQRRLLLACLEAECFGASAVRCVLHQVIDDVSIMRYLRW